VIPDLSGITLLLVDDDISSLYLLREFFEPTGAILHLASNENELYTILDNCTFKIALLDIKFGKISGLNLLPEIKKRHPGVIVIAQTAYALSDDEDFFISAGFDGYLSKPIRFDKLMETICSLMRKLV
jgi:CheY-like chemotaxis protein